MSTKEVDQILIFEKLKAKALSQREASRILHLSLRQVKRKMKKYREVGALSLVHAARGKPGNRSLGPLIKKSALTLVKEKYADFSPTFASEKLAELHGIMVNKETLRQWMTDSGIGKATPLKQGTVHVWRERRSCRGELVQLDGSYHNWFEDRADRCCLLAFIDDATSELLWAEFCESESTECLMQATNNYLMKEGRPVSVYADRGSVYQVNKGNENKDRVTQYERALTELTIELIPARSPQAKGRVERLFGTLQNRLVKELRLAEISGVQEANIFLRDTYFAKHNQQFSVAPKDATDVHRALEGYRLQEILCIKATRKLQNDWCLSYFKRWLQLDPQQPVVLHKNEAITVNHYLDGSLHLTKDMVVLTFKELTERPVPPAPVPKDQAHKKSTAHVPAATHPWKHDYFINRKRDISILV